MIEDQPREVSTLLEISSDPLSANSPYPLPRLKNAEDLIAELEAVLRARNGFFAFESALHVYPSDPMAVDDIGKWNAREGWRDCYGGMADDAVFFAQDIFAEQFAITTSGIIRFKPETGECRHMAATLGEWAGIILRDYGEETGWPIAHEWQITNGVLYRGQRLAPRVPFVLGGEYELPNFTVVDGLQAMRHWGTFAQRLRDVPDGSSFSYDPIQGLH